jgi:hypothetical protein
MIAETPELKVARLKRNKEIFDGVALARAKILLERDRAARPDIWSDPNPLISVHIATYNRPKLIVERAIASVLRQTYQNFEIVVVGDHAGPETGEAIAKVGDPRIRYYNLPERPTYAEFPRFRWSSIGSYPVIKAHELARGAWIAPIDDDDEYFPDHLEVLLKAARAHRLEMVYSVMEAQWMDGSWMHIGSAPLRHGQICHPSVLYSARLHCLQIDPWCWINDIPGDWSLWSRMQAIGAEIGFVPYVGGRHYAELEGIDPEERVRVHQRVATPEEILGDLARTKGDFFLDLA